MNPARATGQLLMSRSAASEISDRLWSDYRDFAGRDLSEIEVDYLFVDAVFESLRRHGAKEALLVALYIAADGGKSQEMIPWAWAVRNCCQVGPERRGAGSMPAAVRMCHTVDGAIRSPRASSPWMRRCPHNGLSAAIRRTSCRRLAAVGGRPCRRRWA
jgi:hypothetical protein